MTDRPEAMPQSSVRRRVHASTCTKRHVITQVISIHCARAVIFTVVPIVGAY